MDGLIDFMSHSTVFQSYQDKWLNVMKHSLGLGRILPPARFNLRPHGPKSGALTVRPCSRICTCMDLCLDLPGQCNQVLKLGVGREGGALYIYDNSLWLL